MRNLLRGGPVALGACFAIMLGCVGCGSQGDETGDVVPVPPVRQSVAPTTEVPQPRPQPSSKVPPKPPDGGNGKRTLRTIEGTIARAAEPDCVVLATADATYVLLGAPAKISALKPGTAVTVRGTVATSTATTCQQGTPLLVRTAHPA